MAENTEQQPVQIDVATPKGAFTFLKVILEGENIQMSGKAFTLVTQSLSTIARIITELEGIKKANELGDSTPTLEKVQDTESK
jgi:hypothetical protein